MRQEEEGNTYYAGKIAAWAAEPDTKAKRDYVFVYVWQFCKIIADIACLPEEDKILVEGELVSGLMSAIDRGRYKGERSFMGWLFMQAHTELTNSLFGVHRTTIKTVPYHTEEGDIEIQGQEAEEVENLVDATGLEKVLLRFEDPRQVRIMQMYYLEGVTEAEIAKTLGVGSTTVGRLRVDALTQLQEVTRYEDK